MTDDKDTQFWLETVKDIKPATNAAFVPAKSAPKIRINEHRYFAVKQEFSTYSKALEDNEFGGIDKATLKKFKKEE